MVQNPVDEAAAARLRLLGLPGGSGPLAELGRGVQVGMCTGSTDRKV